MRNLFHRREVLDLGLGRQHRRDLLNSHTEVLLCRGYGVIAVRKAAIRIVGSRSGNSHPVLGFRKMRDIAGVRERVPKDDDGGVPLGMGQDCGESEDERREEAKEAAWSTPGSSR